MLLLLGAAMACSDTEVLEVWPDWGPVNGQGLIRVQTGGDNATLQIIDGDGAAWPVTGAPSIEEAPGEWYSFRWPDGLPDGVATLIAEPGTVQVEVEVQGNLATLPPDGNPRLGAVLMESDWWPAEGCDTEGPTRVVASAEVVLPAAGSGGFVAEISDSQEVLAWVQLGPDRGPVTVETAWSQGDRDELCLSVVLFDPTHFVVSQHALDCEPVPEDLRVPVTSPDGCGCAAPGTPGAPIGALVLLGMLSLVRRKR